MPVTSLAVGLVPVLTIFQPALSPQALHREIQSPQPIRPAGAIVLATPPPDQPPPYAHRTTGGPFDMRNLRETLSPNLPPRLPPRSNTLLNYTNFKNSYEEAIAIEGPHPPERYQEKIAFLKQQKSWSSSFDLFKRMFSPSEFDPASEKSKGDFLFLASYTGNEEAVRSALAAGADPCYGISSQT